MTDPIAAQQAAHYAYFDYENIPGKPIRYCFDTLEHANEAAALLPALPEWVKSVGLIRQCKPDFEPDWNPAT